MIYGDLCKCIPVLVRCRTLQTPVSACTEPVATRKGRTAAPSPPGGVGVVRIGGGGGMVAKVKGEGCVEYLDKKSAPLGAY